MSQPLRSESDPPRGKEAEASRYYDRQAPPVDDESNDHANSETPRVESTRPRPIRREIDAGVRVAGGPMGMEETNDAESDVTQPPEYSTIFF